MAQVLKEEIRNKILIAAETIFYEKDYKRAKLTDIANKTVTSVALIYSYFKNKTSLLDEIVRGILNKIIKIMEEEEKLEVGSALERFNQGSAKYLLDILKDRIRLKILIDKSVGTKHEEAKDIWVSRLETYIEEGLKCYSNNNP
ncbi:MAG: TetR/AcrR family transcriptional regulator, partial [Fusobacterium sp.]|uniref:TetR/AcrR family transcriptional regulator n=1 Tax=Fusobacterium sp. TaxID=68766 RepID=UPI0026DB52DD